MGKELEKEMAEQPFKMYPKWATDAAQMIHNQIDTNGDINEGKIIECMVEQYAEWLQDNIDWDKISDDDESVREFVEEREEAMRGEY